MAGDPPDQFGHVLVVAGEFSRWPALGPAAWSNPGGGWFGGEATENDGATNATPYYAAPLLPD